MNATKWWLTSDLPTEEVLDKIRPLAPDVKFDAYYDIGQKIFSVSCQTNLVHLKQDNRDLFLEITVTEYIEGNANDFRLPAHWLDKEVKNV